MRVASRSHQTINLGLGLRLNHAHVASTTPHSCVGPSEIDRSSFLSHRFSFVSFLRALICFDLLFELRVELIYCLFFGLPLQVLILLRWVALVTIKVLLRLPCFLLLNALSEHFLQFCVVKNFSLLVSTSLCYLLRVLLEPFVLTSLNKLQVLGLFPGLLDLCEEPLQSSILCLLLNRSEVLFIGDVVHLLTGTVAVLIRNIHLLTDPGGRRDKGLFWGLLLA